MTFLIQSKHRNDQYIVLSLKYFEILATQIIKGNEIVKVLSQLTSLNLFNLLIVKILKTLTKNINTNPVKIIFTTSENGFHLKY